VWGETWRLFLTVRTQLFGLHPPLLFPFLRSLSSQSDASLCASPSAGAATSLPTSVVGSGEEVQYRLAAPRVGEEARRPQIVNQLFPLPVSFRVSAHRGSSVRPSTRGQNLNR